MAEIKVRVGQQNAIKVTSSLAGSGAGTLGAGNSLTGQFVSEITIFD